MCGVRERDEIERIERKTMYDQKKIGNWLWLGLVSIDIESKFSNSLGVVKCL